MSNILDYRIPEGGNLVKCHLTWINDFLPQLEVVLGRHENCNSLEDYLKLIIDEDGLGNRTTNQDDDAIRNSEDGHETLIGFMGAKLAEVAILTYVGKLDLAEDILRDLCNMVNEFSANPEVEGLEEYRMRAFDYCSSAANYQIQVFRGNVNSKLRENLWSSKGLFSIRNQFMAAINFFKACFARALRLEEESIAKLEKAIKLDPNCFHWHRTTVNILRTSRKRKTRSDRPRPYVDPREINYSDRLRQIASNVPVVMLDEAIRLKDELWDEPSENWSDVEINRVINAFQNVIVAVKNDQLIIWNKEKLRLKAEVILAEFALFGSGNISEDYRRRGSRLLEERARNYPNNSHILHLMGKMHQGIFPYLNRFENRRRSQQCFEEALRICPTNFSALMSFLELLRATGEYAMMMEITENFLAVATRPRDIVKARIERAYVIWIFNPRKNQNNRGEACNNWLNIFTDFSDNDYRDEVCNSIKRPPNWVKEQQSMGDQGLNREVICELRRMRNCTRDRNGDEIMKLFMDWLEPLEEENLNLSCSNNWAGAHNLGMPSSSQSDSNGNQSSHQQLVDQMGNLRFAPSTPAATPAVPPAVNSVGSDEPNWRSGEPVHRQRRMETRESRSGSWRTARYDQPPSGSRRWEN